MSRARWLGGILGAAVGVVLARRAAGALGSLPPLPSAGSAPAEASATGGGREAAGRREVHGRRSEAGEVQAVLRHRVERYLLRRADLAQALDATLFLEINGLPHPPALDRGMELLSLVVDRGAVWVLFLMADLTRDRAHAHEAAKDVLPSLWLVAMSVEGPVKAVFRRKRPFIDLVDAVVVGPRPGGHSFPSGHTATAFAGAWLMARHYPEWRWRFYALASTVGFARVYKGVHYPGDVTVGAVVGTLLAAGYRRVIAALRRRRAS